MPQVKTDPNAVWEALPGSQQIFLNSPIFETLYDGTRGPGKTDSILMSFAQMCERGYGERWQGAIFRREYKELDDLVTKSKRWFPRLFPGRVRWLGSKSDYRWIWDTGEVLRFRAAKNADAYWSYHGHEIPFLGFEELTNWPTLDFYLSMHSVCRTGDPRVPTMIRATANPWGSGHGVVKQRFVDVSPPGVPYTDPETGKERVRIYGSISENPYLTDDYIDTLLSATSADAEKRKAWLTGSWDIASGGIFESVWKKHIHEVEPFVVPASWRVDRALDWGSSKPYAAAWYAEANDNPAMMANGEMRHFPRGSVFIIAECYGWNGTPNVGIKHTNKQIAGRVKETEAGLYGRLIKPGVTVHNGPADASIFDVINGDSYADEMARNGVTWLPSYKGPGSRVQGWQRIASMLQAAKANDKEQPHLYVFANCKHWLRTVPILPRDVKNPDDVDTEAEDHHGDQSRYRLVKEPPQEPHIQQIGWTN